MVTEPAGRRRGRPPASDSADTRQEIIDAARRLFAERGYGGVTNKQLAAAAGITPGALYHYVASKLDLYVCVHRDLQRKIYGRFVEAVGGTESLTMFFGTVRVDVRRFPEIQQRLAASEAGRQDFFASLADAGIASGEVCADRRELLAEFIRVAVVGITEGASTNPARHHLALESIGAALRGELLGPRTIR